jgi:general secretion pathway protein J
MTAGCCRADSGFTIVELLVSLALMVLVASFLIGGVQFGHRVWDLTARIDQAMPVPAVREALQLRLAAALPVQEVEEDGSLRMAFRGAPDRLSFVAALPARQLPAGLYKLDLRLGDDHALVLASSDFQQRHPGGRLPGTLTASTLMAQVSGLSLRYYGAAEPGDDKAWHSSWERADAIPDLIGITLGFAPGDLRRWPELIIRLRIEGA